MKNDAMKMGERVACPRQLLIGIDAMEWSLVSRWAREGKLPTLARLMEQGARAVLSTTAEQFPYTAWASLYTGSNPAKLEKFFHVQYDARTQGLRHLMDDVILRATFWDILSQVGKRVGVVDVPYFALSRSLNGIQVTNWGAHATKTARASYPGTLLSEIEARFGRHPVRDCDAVDQKPQALRGLRDRLLAGVRLRGEVNRWLMGEHPWDVFFAAFCESHCVGHHFWHFLDPTHPRHRMGDPDGLADTIEQVYRAIDHEIGEMLALAGEDTVCMVFASHGMGPLYHASWNLPEILDLLGYGRAPASEALASARASRPVRVNPWRILKMMLPGRLQYAIKGMLPRAVQEQLISRWYTGGRRWAGSRAFAIPNNDTVGAIRVAVQGRDRYGTVAPGEEYERVCREIAAAMRELTDPESGRPIVQRVTLTHEAFHGPFVDQLPDVTVLWDASFRWEALRSPRFGTLRLRKQDSRTGSHTPRGFLLTRGPNVPAGVELMGHSVYDIAPTVLAIAGVPVPADMDGQVLPLQCAAAPA